MISPLAGPVAELVDAADLKSAEQFAQPFSKHHLATNSKSGGAPNGAPLLDSDSDLHLILDAWPTLPKAIKVGMLAMVKASQ